MKHLIILISGRGSNMHALIRACKFERWPARIVAVIANRPDALGLKIAQQYGIPTQVINHQDFQSRHSFEEALHTTIDRFCADFILLAGFMRILSAYFVALYPKRLLNIHPSLLPAFPGLNTHERALNAGVKVHGATVYFVTHKLDQGPIIAQAPVSVFDDDTPQLLAERVLQAEHFLYCFAVRQLIYDRLHICAQRVMISKTSAD